MAKNMLRNVIIVLIVLLLVTFIFKFYIVVDAGERAVIFNRLTGKLSVSHVGLTFLAPIIQTATVYDVRTRTYTMSIIKSEGEIHGDDSLDALSSDGQDVKVDISVRFHPDAHQLDDLHQNIGVDYVNKVIRPQVRSITRQVISNFPVVDIYSGNRQHIQDEVYKKLVVSFKYAYIILEEVLLRNVQFNKEFQDAIQSKQIAQQRAQEMKYVLEKQEQEKKRRIIEAEGEAESIRIKGKALSESPSLIQYEYVKLIAPNVAAIITDQKGIFNFSDFLKIKK